MNFNLLKNLCEINAVSGNEDSLRNFIISKIKNYVSKVDIDVLGNLIAKKDGKNSSNKGKIVLTTNIDEPGLIINHITDDGFLKFSTIGQISPKVLLGTRVLVGENNLPGMVGVTPVHLLKSEQKYKEVLVKDMYIDIGAKSKKDATQNINLGDFACFEPSFTQNDNTIIARALSTKAACFLLINLIQKEYNKDVYFSFTTNGNIDFSGAKTMAYNLNPKLAIILSATNTEKKNGSKLQNGPILPFMEPGVIHDKELYNKILNLAKENKIPVQSIKTNTKTAGSVISKSKNGVLTASIAIPCKYANCPVEMCSILDIENTEKLLSLILN